MSTWAWKTGEQYHGYCEWYCYYYNIIIKIIGRYKGLFLIPGLSPINVSVEITSSGAKVLGQSGYSLTCVATVTGTDAGNPSITYQWTKNNGTQTHAGTDRVLSFSPLRLSDAGRYTCHTVTSPCSITGMDTQEVTLQSEFNYT